MPKPTKMPTLAQAANTLAAVLGSILQMSDAVKKARSPLDAQGKLLALQASIQKNGARIVPHVQTVLAAVAAEATGGEGPTFSHQGVAEALIRQADAMERGETPERTGPEALRDFAQAMENHFAEPVANAAAGTLAA